MPRPAGTGQRVALAALLLLGAAVPAAGAPLPLRLQHGSKLAGDGKTEDDWQVLSYGFDVDPSTPGFIKTTTQLFKLTADDVSVDTQQSRADGETVYSTTDDTRASKLAVGAHIEGGKGPFSGAASMEVTDDADHEIKTARLDITRSFNKYRVTSQSVFRVLPQTRLDPAYTDYIKQTPIESIEQIPDALGIFYARSTNLGGLIRKSYTMQVTTDDTQSGLTAELKAKYGGLIGGGASFGKSTDTRSNGAAMRTSFHAEGGDTSVWLKPGEDLDDIQKQWAESFDKGGRLYPWGVELRPIWELVQKVDKAKGDALETYLTQKWAREAGEFSPTRFFDEAPSALWRLGDMTMRSVHNSALVRAVEYTGPRATLSWELQHSLCAAAGRATPGSDISHGVISCDYHDGSYHPESCSVVEWQTKKCAYSPDDNHVVANWCNWSDQEFTHVSGSLGGGVGYMCAGSGGGDCGDQVRVEGTAAAYDLMNTAAAHHGRWNGKSYDPVTLNSGDAVFCSA